MIHAFRFVGYTALLGVAATVLHLGLAGGVAAGLLGLGLSVARA